MIRLRPTPPGAAGRVYAVGDVHGCFDLFRDLMALIERDQAGRPPADTQIVLLGDIIDRGPQSAKMVQGCMNLTRSTDRFRVLKGNHEELMTEALGGDLQAYEAWLHFGGRETLRSWGVDAAVVDGDASLTNLEAAAACVGEDVLRWMADLPLYHQHGDHLLVHAGLRPGVRLAKQRREDLLWIREDFLDADADHGVTIVHGHTVGEAGPVVGPGRIGIDTGAYRTGRLTALGIEAGETWSLSTTPGRGAPHEDGRRARVSAMTSDRPDTA